MFLNSMFEALSLEIEDFEYLLLRVIYNDLLLIYLGIFDFAKRLKLVYINQLLIPSAPFGKHTP